MSSVEPSLWATQVDTVNSLLQGGHRHGLGLRCSGPVRVKALPGLPRAVLLPAPKARQHQRVDFGAGRWLCD